MSIIESSLNGAPDHAADSAVVLALIAAAVRVAECEQGAVYVWESATLNVVARTGGVQQDSAVMDASVRAESFQDGDGPRFITHAQSAATWSSASIDEHRCDAPLAFLAMYPLGTLPGGVKGVFVLASSIAQTSFSAAQGYVLQAILTKLQSVPPFSPLESDSQRHMPSAERLRLLESVVVNARDSILITEAEPIDLPGPRIVYCNPAFEVTTGYAEKDIIGQTPRILHGPGTDRTALAKLKSALRAWKPVEVELRNYRKDGSEFWVELSIVPVADERGWFTHWVSVQRDITERKALGAASIQAREDEEEKQRLYSSLAERQRTHDALYHAAMHDALTGLRSRTYLVERIRDALQGAPHSAVLYLDLDGFKMVNDSLGHAAGDALLREVAARLQKCITPTDTLARISGDEFVILVHVEESGNFLQKLAERINARLSDTLSAEFSGFYLSCSIGIVALSKAHQDAEEVLRDADAAMYCAKRVGTGEFMFFQTEMREQATELIRLQKDVRLATANQDFEVHYQPFFDIRTRNIAGMEALIRWTHPKRGAVPPAEFIPVAEQIGIIGLIDQWVRGTAFQQFNAWRAQVPTLKLQLNVNVSALELRDSGFLSNLERVAVRTGFSLSHLQIELTESVLLDDSPTTMALLRAIRERGVRVAFDDFGTGYSSLAYIANYEIDTLKIDRSFVIKMLENVRTMSVLESIIYLAKKLKLDVVAEGVETEPQLAALLTMGCDYVQGYLLSRPIPATAFTELIMQGRHAGQAIALP